MDFEFYRNFITVAEAGNLTAAARKLAVAQPALSAQLKILEEHYGTPLIKTKRGQRQLQLTEAGEAFLANARRLCATEESLQLQLQGLAEQASGTLRISVSPVPAAYFLKRYLMPFAKKHPHIRYQFYEEAVERQLERLREQSIDFAYANAPLPALAGLQLLPGRRESFYAVYSKEYGSLPFSGKTITLSALAGQELCCSFSSYTLLRKLCREAGFTPNIRFIATTISSAAAFAAAGSAIAVIADAGDLHLPEEMVCKPLECTELSFRQTLYWNSEQGLSAAGKLFLEFYKGI